MTLFYNAAKPWNYDICPNTCSTAVPRGLEQVKHVSVIEVKGARYRMAEFDGTFVLADPEQPDLPKRGIFKVKVYCLWFGHRLPSGLPITLKVDGSTSSIHRGYSGRVTSNLAR